MENTEQNILEVPDIKIVPAGYGKRFVNYLVDFFIFCFLASIVLKIIAPIYPLEKRILNKEEIGLEVTLMIYFFYGLYMSVMETLLKGKSIGKYITGTRAVTASGLPVDSQTAFIRGLVRAIPFPFEQVSAITLSFDPFGLRPPYPWHDRWSRSFVVDEAKSILPKK